LRFQLRLATQAQRDGPILGIRPRRVTGALDSTEPDHERWPAQVIRRDPDHERADDGGVV